MNERPIGVVFTHVDTPMYARYGNSQISGPAQASTDQQVRACMSEIFTDRSSQHTHHLSYLR